MSLILVRWIADEALLYGFVEHLPTILLLVLVFVCILILSKGADWMIEGVVALSSRTGLPRIVIGATIISLGTTTPEAFVSVMAAWMGDPGLALGNGVGSIIADTGLIFGLTCSIATVPVNRFILNRTGWVQVGSATLLVVISLGALLVARPNPVLGRATGLFFLALLVCYLLASYVWAKQGAADIIEVPETIPEASLGKSCFMIAGGLLLVVVSARVLIPCASALAKRIGVPEDVIAATMVAFGTSLPELMTAVASVRKGHPEIMVGNIVGADVLNCLFVIGAAAVARPLEIPGNFFTFHFPAMLIILYSFRVFIFMNKDGRFKRFQGIWLLGVYVVYVVLQYTIGGRS
ncbi:MAG: sodium:calcium antiporter [Deltaproteobacteria bacterium]|nr:sodium:calcium antiporter [Deltaproteobacteria bacterium]MBW2046198.1 sodium:calcium antiporter [Deltaproteobacteria bacterium]MBW2300755.1 sodium:calcium antiporter [Deltaproteobacteria bacterium]